MGSDMLQLVPGRMWWEGGLGESKVSSGRRRLEVLDKPIIGWPWLGVVEILAMEGIEEVSGGLDRQRLPMTVGVGVWRKGVGALSVVRSLFSWFVRHGGDSKVSLTKG